jgi:tol-pal system protein YbgF
MKILFILFLIFFISTRIYADDQISRKALKFDRSNELLERLEILEQEMRQLINKIEILEHNFVKLEHGVGISKDSRGDKIENLTDSAPNSDVFEIPSTKDKVLNDTANVSGNNVPKEKQLYDLALAALKENRLEESEEKFAEFLKNYPNSSLVSNAYFWYGESFFRRNLFQKAAINYLKGYKQSPKGVKASDSLLKLALSLGGLKKMQEACSILNQLETEFPKRATSSVKRAKDASTKFGCKY